MILLPTKEEEERYKYYDSEKLKVLKKYARQELNEINERKLHGQVGTYDETRAKFLKFVLKSVSFARFLLNSFQKRLKKLNAFLLWKIGDSFHRGTRERADCRK